MTQALIKFDEARRALAAAVKPVQAKLLRDKAAALEMYARQARDTELEVMAAEIRVRAERRVGELLLDTEFHRGGRPSKKAAPVDVAETLEKLGITKRQSALCQRLAKIPERTFEDFIRDCHTVGNPPRSATLVRPGRDDKLAVLHSSASDEHYTPHHIVTLVEQVFGGSIDLDPCCNRGKPNVPATQHYRIEQNGLNQPWHGNVYCNPPYGDAVGPWVEKALIEFQEGRTDAIILLLAARTDTQSFHALRDFPVCFIKGRLTFIGNVNPAPFPSVLFWVSEQDDARFASVFADIGTVYQPWTA